MTVAALLLGYSGYYLCRSDLAVATPLLLAQSGALTLDRKTIGAINSIGVLFYAGGKLVSGVVGDFVGGRRMFLVGLFGAVAATVAFGAGTTVTVLAVAWAVNRFVQSAGWSGMVKITSFWFSASRYGTVMAVLSLSYLFGDAVGRCLLGGLMTLGMGWRGLFYTAAALLAVIGLFNVAMLRSTPRDVGLSEPDVNARNVYGDSGQAASPDSLSDLLLPFVSSPSFWWLCAMSFGLTLVREAMNAWIPAYLVDNHQVSAASAARYSAVFPFAGGLATLAAGWTSDRFGEHRTVTIVPCLAICAVSLAVLAAASRSGNTRLAMFAIANVAFWLLGPYSLLAGAMALDVGGRKGSATAAGLIDTAGYAGAVLSGYGIGQLVEGHGWANVFQALAVIVGLTVMAALMYKRHERRDAFARAAA